MVTRAVVDANALLALVLNDERQQLVAEAVSRLGGNEPIHAPYFLISEVANALHRATRAGAITRGAAHAAGRALDAAGIIFHGPPDIVRLLAVVEDLGHSSAYDATYVALAVSLQAPLLTLDRRLGVLARGRGVSLMLDL